MIKKKKRTMAGLYKEKNLIGALAKLKSAPSQEYYIATDAEQKFTISEVRYRISETGALTPVFTLKELNQSPNLRFTADQLWITDICTESENEPKVWIGTGNVLNPTLDGLKPYPILPAKKTGIDYKMGQSVIILIPATSLLKATKDNGFGGKVEFDTTYDIPGFNGKVVNLEGIDYKLYGQVFLNEGTCYIYID